MQDGIISNVHAGRMDRVLEVEDRMLVAICTQCCDLDPTNTKSRSGVSIAPLRRPPIRPDEEERRAQIIASAARDDNGTWSWFHLFPVLIDVGAGEELAVIDYSAITTIGNAKNAVPHLLGQKAFEMPDDLRTQFREKLGSMFGRPVND